MAKKKVPYKFSKYQTSAPSQHKELQRLVASVEAAVTEWVEAGHIAPETANHRLSCLYDLLASQGLSPLPKAELENFKNPPLQMALFS